MDEELFELCEEVYEKTGWIDDHGGEFIKDSDKDDTHINLVRMYTNFQKRSEHSSYPETVKFKTRNYSYSTDFLSPFYTTDYLLEKLPKFSPVAKDAYLTVIEKQTPKDKREDFYWTAGYFTGHGWSYTGQSDTPLKALLRLTLALYK